MGILPLLLAAGVTAASSLAPLPDTVRPGADTTRIAPEAAASPASGSPAEGPVTPAEATPAPAVAVGQGTLLVNGFLQTWYAAATDVPGAFRVRAAELTFSGAVTPRARWLVKVDAAKGLVLRPEHQGVESPVLSGVQVNQGSRILQDAFITLSLDEVLPGLQLRAGQGKLPLGLEHGHAPSGLPTLERARFLSDGARGGLGIVRDVGVLVRGRATPAVRWEGGLWNGMGEGMNRPRGEDRRAVTGRATVALPWVTGLELGATGARDVGLAEGISGRQVVGTDFRWSHRGWTLASEHLWITQGATEREGWYVHLDHRTEGGSRPFVRVEGWDPDRSRNDTPASASERGWTLGLTQYFTGEHVKLEGAWNRISSEGAIPARNALILNLQLMW